MQVPMGSPKILMVTAVADTFLRSRLKTNCPPMVQISAKPRKEYQLSAG